MDKRDEGCLKFFHRKFFSHSAKIRRGVLLCFRKCMVSKNFMSKRGISPFSAEIFSQSTEKLRRGSLLCFTKILVSKRIMDERGRGVRQCHDILSKFFCLTVTKIFAEEPFCAVF